MTLGFKFGADFLAYEGDPEICHAKYLVKVCDGKGIGKVPVQELISSERIAN